MAATPGTRVTQTGWNAYSRIDAVEGFASPSLARLYIDSDAWTERAQVGRPDREHPAIPRLVSRAAVHAGPAGDDAHHRPGRRVRRARRARLRQSHGHGRGAEPVDDQLRPPLRRTRGTISTTAPMSRSSRTKAGRSSAGPSANSTRSFSDSWTPGRRCRRAGSRSRKTTSTPRRRCRRTPIACPTTASLVILRWESDIPRLVSNAVALLGADEAARRIVAVIERAIATTPTTRRR